MTKEEKQILTEEIEALSLHLSQLEKGSKEYTEAVEALEKLIEIRGRKKIKIPTELLISGGFALLEILLIMNYEKTAVISTKAFMKIFKGRL